MVAPASAQPLHATPIAIVGVGALFPGSQDATGFWRDILSGRDLTSEVPPTHWLISDHYDPNPAAPDKIYAKRGAFLSAVDFNPLEFAMPPANLSSTDTAQLLALLVAKQVLEDAANGPFAAMDRSRMSVILGVTSATELIAEFGARIQRPVWAHALRQHGLDEAQVTAICDRISSHYVPWTESAFPGMLANVVAGRIANRFDLTGTNCVIDAACGSSLAAMHLAMLELQSGQSDGVITGGVDALNDVLTFTCFSKTPALSPTGDCRPFSAAADGTLLGEGLGMVALKRLADAERDGDRIYAVVRGMGTSSDGLSKSIYAPVAQGQAKALRRAYEAASYGPETVELLEAHGTGTRAGDLAEFQGLASVFKTPSGGLTQGCALGSIKSQIGHTKAAAGSAGLIKAVMALHHKVLPPTIKVDEPNPALNLADSPFYLNTQARPWIRAASHPRRASVSAFGFGGSNYHVTLEEYTGQAPRRPRLRTQAHSLLLVAADSAAQLVERCRALDLQPDAVAHTAHQSLIAWQPAPHRLALVVTPKDAAATLAAAIARIEKQPAQHFALPGGRVHYGVGAPAGPLALLFPGQGSQYVGMGGDLAMAFDAARKVWDQAANLSLGPQPLDRVVFPPPAFGVPAREQQAALLTQTQWAQPAIGAVQLAQLALLRQVGITPAALAGHSFGEFTALAAAGSLSADDLLRVARKRGELMADAASAPGAMTAVIQAPADLVQQVHALGLRVVEANRNTPTQRVYAGAVTEIEQLEHWLASQQLEFRRLPVSTAFHSPLVAPAVAPLHSFLSGIEVRSPNLPVYANSTAHPYPSDPNAIRHQLASQLAEPVRFEEQIEQLYAAGIRTFIEVGPRSALTSFVEQTLIGKPHVALSLDRAGTDAVLAWCQALAGMAAAGVPMQPAALWQEYDTPSAPSPHKPAMSVSLLGVNYGRPYPPAPVASTATLSDPASPQAAQPEFQEWLEQLRREETHSLPPGIADFAAPATPAPTTAVEAASAHTKPVQAVPSAALRETLLAVVSDKTGYPPDMLDLSLELESGLGIDSIKRVEILSDLRDRMPELPEVAPSQLASLNTLGEVLAFMQGAEPAATQALQPAGTSQIQATPQQAAGPTAASIAPSPALPRHTVRTVPQAAAGFVMPGLLQEGALIGVTDDGHRIAPLVVQALVSHGIQARLIRDPAASADCTGLIVLSGLQPVSDPQSAIQVNRRAFEFVHAMAPRLSEREGLLVTVQDTGGDFGLTGRAGIRAYLGGIAALARTAANEWPQAAVKAIDLEMANRAPAALAKALVSELLQGGAEREVGLLAKGERVTLATELCAAPAGPCTIDSSSVVLATGGGRGVTALCLQAMARKNPRIAILGRTPLQEEPASVQSAKTDPDIKRALLAHEKAQGRQPTPIQLSVLAQQVQAAREVRRNLQSMQDAGAQVLYLAADVSDARSVQQAVAQVWKKFGPVTCLVHGAGVLADKLIKDKTLAQYDSVFSTKVESLANLLTALRDDPLQAMVLFSSVAARVGNPGQSDYAMANEVLNQIALTEAASRPGCVVRSIGWGPWDGGMVTPTLRAHFDAQGVALIEARAGAAAFMAELNAGGPEVQLVIGPGEPRELLARDTGHRGAVTAELVINPQRYPFLASHRIGADPVVPVVLVAEWFMQAAMALVPGAPPPVLRDLRVLRGIVLKGWGQTDHRLRVSARFEPGASRQVRCELTSLDGLILHDSATVDFTALAPEATEPIIPGLQPCDTAGWTLYETPALFHGPELQSIRRLTGTSDHGLTAELFGCRDLGWSATPRLLDLPALDGGLQLAVTWLFQRSGADMLPTHLGELRLHRHQAPEHRVRCTLHIQSVTALKAVCDITLVAGAWTAQMSGVQMHARVAVPVEPALG